MPLFSTIIPVYNREPFLRQTLDSALAQEFADQEIICVDDGSTDGSAAVIEEYAAQGVKLIRQKNQGPGVARNSGAAAAAGEYLAFLDSDDVWFPWTLLTYKNVITASSTRPSLILGKGLWFNEPASSPTVYPTATTYATYQNYFSSSKEPVWVGSGGLIVRRETFERIGGFNSTFRIAEDLDLFLRLGLEPNLIVINAPFTFGYRQHSRNSIKNLDDVLCGIFAIMNHEHKGMYPGDTTVIAKRQAIIARFLRPASISAIKGGRLQDAWRLYVGSFRWNIRNLRFKYVFGAPAKLLISVMISRRSPFAIRR